MSENTFKIIVGQSHYLAGKKYCKRCECYFLIKNIFCQCCGIVVECSYEGGSPTEREYKEKLNRERESKGKLGIVLKPSCPHD